MAMNEQSLRLSNPFVFTAEDSYNFFKNYGKKEIQDFFDKLKIYKPDSEINDDNSCLLHKAISIYKEIRYKSAISLFSTIKNFTFLDLACGFTPRGLWMDSQNLKYIGGDLPFIINRIEPVVKESIKNEYGKNITYKVIDVTNPITMNDAVSKINNPLFISTEGLLMYLNDSELKMLIENIGYLLSKHGGYWVTMDIDIKRLTLEIVKILFDNDLESLTKILTSQKKESEDFLSQHKGFKVYDNELYNNNNMIDYFENFGFSVTEVPLSTLVQSLVTLNDVSEEKRNKIYSLLSSYKIYSFTKTSDYKTVIKPYIFDNSFEVKSHVIFNQLSLSVKGRLDSLTAENLLIVFNDYLFNYEFDTIIVNFSELDYISSAGLRILLIMYKKVPEIKRFMILDCNSTVYSVLQDTGMTEYFQCARI